MTGFIYLIDEFRQHNGATCFVSGSQGMETPPASPILTPVCGPAGSLIVFNGSVWHGHGANQTDQPRRSIQGAYIRRSEKSGGDLPARMLPETLDRMSALAKYLLDV
jgi:ectoine hydroxylase-related dioxygenase (phytanoyl-CoA dioxygenase family)